MHAWTDVVCPTAMCAQAGVKPNVRTYTALIAALGAAKQWERALATLRSLREDKSAGHVEPNAYTYSALLKAMGEHGQWALAEQVCALRVPACSARAQSGIACV